MIYFDNAATSFPKPKCVVEELYKCVCEYCGNPGRGAHTLSRMSSEKIYEAREAVARHFGTDAPESVVFTYNATHAINLALKAYTTEESHIITSDLEHNAVIRPLEALKKRLGVSYSTFDSDGDIRCAIDHCIKENTRGIVCTLASNVTGKRIPLSELSDIAKAKGLFLIVDASQAAGHETLDLGRYPADVLCAPGHKGLFGIQGSGFAIFKEKERRDTLIEGGSGSWSESREMPRLLPDGYEAGTLATPAIVTLARGIEFVDSVGVNEIYKRVYSLAQKLYERISNVRNTTVYCCDSGIVSFNLDNISSSRVASELDRYGICTRAGLHCAPSAHHKLGTIRQGVVRASLSYFNNEREIDAFYKALYEIANK